MPNVVRLKRGEEGSVCGLSCRSCRSCSHYILCFPPFASQLFPTSLTSPISLSNRSLLPILHSPWPSQPEPWRLSFPDYILSQPPPIIPLPTGPATTTATITTTTTTTTSVHTSQQPRPAAAPLPHRHALTVSTHRSTTLAAALAPATSASFARTRALSVLTVCRYCWSPAVSCWFCCMSMSWVGRWGRERVSVEWAVVRMRRRGGHETRVRS